MQFIVKTVRNSQKNVQSICAGNQLLLAVCWDLAPDMWEMTLLQSTAVSEVKSTPSTVKVCPAIEISQPRTSLLLKEKTVFETQNCQRALLTLPQDLIPHSKTFLQTATPSQTHQTELLSYLELTSITRDPNACGPTKNGPSLVHVFVFNFFYIVIT